MTEENKPLDAAGRAAEDAAMMDAPLPAARTGYVITRDGRAYSEEGLLALTDAFFARYPLPEGAAPDSGILWHAGSRLNDPGLMADILKERPDSIIVLSMPDDIRIFNGADDGLGELLGKCLEAGRDSGRTVWEIMHDLWSRRAGKEG